MTTTTLGKDINQVCWSVQTDYSSEMGIAMFWVLPPGHHRHKENVVIGQASLGIEGNKALIDIRIDGTYQNRQIGTLLVMFVENWAVKHGIKTIYGDISKVDSDHLKTLRHFYTKLGFKFDLFHASQIKGNIVGHIEKTIGN
jgi:GNAT superfamily N-acetyltransferase